MLLRSYLGGRKVALIALVKEKSEISKFADFVFFFLIFKYCTKLLEYIYARINFLLTTVFISIYRQNVSILENHIRFRYSRTRGTVYRVRELSLAGGNYGLFISSFAELAHYNIVRDRRQVVLLCLLI